MSVAEINDSDLCFLELSFRTRAHFAVQPNLEA
jgi:hypothetical protein